MSNTTTQVEFRRGTAAENASFIGASGEVVVDIDQWRLIVHDSGRLGGHTGAKFTDLNDETITNAVYKTGTQIITGQKTFASTVYLNGTIRGPGYVYDQNGLFSMGWGGRLLFDSTSIGNLSLDWDNRTLNTTNGSLSSLNWNSGIALNPNYGGSPNTLNWYDCNLSSLSNALTLDWNNGYLYDGTGNITINWPSKTLTGNWNLNGHSLENSPNVIYKTGMQIITGNKYFNIINPNFISGSGYAIDNNSNYSINWNTRQLYGPANYPIVDWNNFRLLNDDNAGGILSVDWKNRILYQGNLLSPSINWGSYQTNDSVGALSIDYSNRILTGKWTVDSLYISGKAVSTGVNSTPSNVVYQTGNQTISGNKTFVGTINTSNYITFTSPYFGLLLEDAYTNFVLHNANIVQFNGNTAANWSGGTLYSTLNNSSALSLDWNNRILTGNWNANSLYISGSPVLTAANGGGIIALSGSTGSYIFSNIPISGFSQQYISFPINLGNSPLVVPFLTNLSGSENISVQSSGINSSGYWANYSNTIDSSGYLLTTIVSTSTQGTLGNTYIIQNFSSGLTTGDYYSNTNPSGFITANQTGQFTGAFYPLNTNPSSYITSGQTGQFYPASNPRNYITGTTLPSSGFSINIDWSLSNTFYTTLTSNSPISFYKQQDGQSIVVAISNTGNANYSGIWPANIKWPGRTIPIQTTGSYTDIYTFINITGGIYGSVVQGF